MNWPAISAIVQKDLSVALRTRAVIMPLVVVPLILLVGLPVAMGFVVSFADQMGTTIAQTNGLDGTIPSGALEAAQELTRPRAGLIFFLIYLIAPLYLILPIMVSSVVAADSFAGEKERKTFESLAYTPTSDRELLLAKLIGGWVPGVMVGIGGFIVYTIVADLVTWQVIGRLILPNPLWLLLAFWVGPGAAGLGLGVTVLVSARVNTFQEAYQIGSLIVMPVVILLIGQVSGAFFLNVQFVAILGLLLWLLNIGIFFAGARLFKRSEVMARL